MRPPTSASSLLLLLLLLDDAPHSTSLLAAAAASSSPCPSVRNVEPDHLTSRGGSARLQWARANDCPWDREECLKRASSYPDVVEWISWIIGPH